MKVVQVLPALDGGGVEKGTLEVGKYLVDQGHKSIVVSAGGRMVEQLEQEGSRHITWDLGKKSLFTLRHIWAFRRFLRTEKPDILHLRSRMPAWIAYLAWKGLPELGRPKLVTTVHGLYSVSRYSEIMCRGEAVIAVSATVKQYILSNFPRTLASKIHLVYRGADAEEFPFNYLASLEWKERFFLEFPDALGKKILCLPGRLTRLKGHHDYLALIAQLVEEGLDVHALIVGGEDPKRRAYAQELYKRVTAMGLQKVVSFTGSRSDIREIFSISDIVFSLSTKPESFGRTVLEALRLGRPVVGYEHGGVGEILQALYPSGCVKLGSAKELLATTRALLETPVKPELSEKFTKQQMLSSTLEIYEELYD